MRTRISLFITRVFTLLTLGIISMFVAPLAAVGQTTIFNDTFASGGLSTLNPTATSPGTLTGTRTAYEIASAKGATGTIIGSGFLILSTGATSSGQTEAQARFTTTPVTLSAVGQYIEVYYTFTNTANVLNGSAANGTGPFIGLYNSFGSAPTNGTLLWNGGLSTSSNNATTGGAQNWVGYASQFAYSSNTVASMAIGTRPAQTFANNYNQELLYSSVYAGKANVATFNGVLGEPTLTVGNAYTMALQVTYVNSTTVAVTNWLYNGAGLSGSVVSVGGYTALYGGTTSTATNVFTTFDSLAVGYRAGGVGATTFPITNIVVIDYIPAAPTITSLTNQTVIQGSNTTLVPVISGVPTPTYFQWATNGVNIPGANGSTLALTNVQYAQNGYVYSLITSNSVGFVSNAMTLTVIVTPSITGLNNQTASPGDTVTISPTVSGVPTPTLQWQTNGVNLVDDGVKISGSQTSTLYITNAQTTDSGTYFLIASNSAGKVTNSMVLAVSAGNVAPSITGPANITVIQGNNGTFTASVSGSPPPDLRWLDQTGAFISGATSSSLTLNNVQYSQNGYVYSIVASNVVSSVTNSATLTVIVPPSITTQPTNLVVTNTQAASFTVAATGVPTPTYQWNKNGTPISSVTNNSATNATFTIASAGLSDAATYSVTVVNAAGTSNSVSVTLTVNSAMGIATLSPANGATGVCYDTPLYLTFSQPPTLQKAGTIKIYNVTNSTTPVDTINLSQNVDHSVFVSNTNNAYNIQSRTIASDTFTNFPVIITGNKAAIYPHLDLLTSNQTYYVTVDNGTFTDAAGANFAGITATNVWMFTTKIGGPVNATNLVVAQDYSGDFATVQGALDAVPAANTTPTVINIHNGIYTEIVDIHSKNNLVLRGQSRAGTIVGYPNNANIQSSTHYRMAFKVNANDISLDNLTVTNMTPVGGSQAEALMLESNVKRFIMNNCNLGSYQDTLLANGSTGAMGYFYNDLVEGQFDFIWGGGDLFFTNCEIRTLPGYGGTLTGGNVTASRTDNGATGNWPGYNGLSASNGISFVDCSFTRLLNTITSTTVADSNGTTNGNVAWINCSFDANYIAPSVGVLNSQLLWEYSNSNLTDTAAITFGLAVGDSAPALTSGDSRLLAAQSANTWLLGWTPQLVPNILTNPVSQTVNYGSPATFTVVATGIPNPTYQWQTNGVSIPGATSSTLTIPSATSANAGSYTVVVTTSAGTVTSSSATLTVNPPLNTAPTFTAPPSGTNITITVGTSLAISCTATDSDTPAQTLTYALLTGPTNAAVNASSGNFTWRPVVSQAGSVNSIKVSVTDNGMPNLSATNTFTVTVTALTQPTATTPNYSGGQFSVGVSGQVGPDYALQATTNLASGSWTTVATTNSPATMPVILTDTNAGAQPMQFYRVVTGPPLP